MPYYYGTATQQSSNASANTDTLLIEIHSIAGQRAALQKIMGGSYVAPADNAIRLRLHRTGTALLSAGTGIVPNPHAVDGAAALAVATTLPTIGSSVLAVVPTIQLAFNQRGTAMWAAFNADEAITIVGATFPNAQLVVDSQSTGLAVPINVGLIHQE